MKVTSGHLGTSILERERIGRRSRNFEQLVTDVEELMADEPTRREMGRRARAYAIGHHSAQRMVANYETLFKEIWIKQTVESAGELRPV